MKDLHKDEEDDVKEDENKNQVAWFLYDLKFWLLISGYGLLGGFSQVVGTGTWVIAVIIPKYLSQWLKDSEGTRIAASPFAVMDTYSALWLINAIIVLRLKFKIQGLKHFLEGDVY